MKKALVLFVEICHMSASINPENEYVMLESMLKMRDSYLLADNYAVVEEVINEMIHNYPMVKNLKLTLN